MSSRGARGGARGGARRVVVTQSSSSLSDRFSQIKQKNQVTLKTRQASAHDSRYAAAMVARTGRQPVALPRTARGASRQSVGRAAARARVGGSSGAVRGGRGRGATSFISRGGPRGGGRTTVISQGRPTRGGSRGANRGARGSSRGSSRGRGGRGRGRGGKAENVSKEDLDDDLDSYMHSSRSFLDDDLEQYQKERSN